MKTVLPEIPPETLAEWQRVVDLTARLARVPASLIMRTERPKHTVLVSSRTEGKPYDVGREYDLHAVLYCQGVFENDGELVVEDATRDPVWAANEDLAYGMRFYIGYPLKMAQRRSVRHDLRARPRAQRPRAAVPRGAAGVRRRGRGKPAFAGRDRRTPTARNRPAAIARPDRTAGGRTHQRTAGRQHGAARAAR